jgi:hypothetical protein
MSFKYGYFAKRLGRNNYQIFEEKEKLYHEEETKWNT